MIYKLVVIILLVVAACTPEQLLQAQNYQDRIARACQVAMTLVPVAGPLSPWIIGGCGAEAMIARLALDPSSLVWVEELIEKVRGKV